MLFTIEKLRPGMPAGRREPFDIIGRAIPAFDGAVWHITEELYPEPTLKTYPDDGDEDYFDRDDRAAFIALADGKRVGSIRLSKGWNDTARVDDIAVDRAFRRKGIGTALMDAAFVWAKEQGLSRVFVETQDNNLLAVRFYLRYGFTLRGIDTSLYPGEFAGETALFFYKHSA